MSNFAARMNDQTTVSMTNAQLSLLRHAISQKVTESEQDLKAARAQNAEPSIIACFEEHLVKLKTVANILFDHPFYKEYVELPVDEPHVHFTI